MSQPAHNSPILLLAALRDELWPTIRRLKLARCADHFAGTCQGNAIVARITGMGAARAAAAARQAIEVHRPTRVILIGFSGALSPALHVGDIVRPRWVGNMCGEVIPLSQPVGQVGNLSSPASPPSLVGQVSNLSSEESDRLQTCPTGNDRLQTCSTLLTCDHLVCDPAEKLRLGEAHGACIVDMETFAVACIARETNAPLTVIRAVSDDAATALPPAMADWVNADGSPRVSSALFALLRRPTMLPTLLALRRNTRAAALKLADEVVREGMSG